MSMLRPALALLLSVPATAPPVAASDQPPVAALRIAERTTDIAGQRFRYLEAGSGETLVVLLHGWPQDADEWRKVMPRLAARYRVVAPDLPGVGGSTSPSRDFSKAALARDVHALVDSLDARRTILVGHDIGGMVAYAYARQFPGSLAGIAILDVPLPGLAPWDKVETLPQAWHFDFNAQQPLAEDLVTGRQAAYFRYFIDRNAGNSAAVSDRDVAGYASAYGSRAQLAAGFGFYRTFVVDKAFNAAQRAPLVTPMLVAGAERSLGTGVFAMAQALRDHGVADVQSTIIGGAGHWVAEEKPEDVVALIDRFVLAAGKPRR